MKFFRVISDVKWRVAKDCMASAKSFPHRERFVCVGLFCLAWFVAANAAAGEEQLDTLAKLVRDDSRWNSSVDRVATWYDDKS